jgi:hypothetical protein
LARILVELRDAVVGGERVGGGRRRGADHGGYEGWKNETRDAAHEGDMAARISE